MLNIGNVRFDGIEATSSITATMPLLCTLGVIGIVWLVRSGPLRALAVGGLVGAGTTTSFFGMSNRYLSDFVPFLVTAAIAGIVVFRCWTPRKRAVKIGGIALLLVLGVWGVYVNAAFAGQFNGVP